MANIFQRVFQYVANEFIVDFLANNRLFQRFVIKSNEKFKKSVEASKQKLEELKATEAGHRISSKMNTSQSQMSFFGQTFFGKLKEEITKEINKHMRR